MNPIKQFNKVREEKKTEAERKAKVKQDIVTAKEIFAYIADMTTIYDAQTVLNAINGFVKLAMIERENKLTIRDLSIDLSKEKNSEIRAAMEQIIMHVEDKNAKQTARLIEVMSSKLPEFLSLTHLKDPMSTIKVEDFIS